MEDSNTQQPDETAQATPVEPQAQEHTESQPEQEGRDDSQLNEGGLKALRQERAARKAAEAAAKEQQRTFEERLKALEDRNNALEAEKFQRRVTDIAAAKLQSPQLALKLTDVNPDMDDKQIGEAIDKLLETSPELAKTEKQQVEDPFQFASHIKNTPQNAHDMNAIAFGNMLASALNR